MYTPISPVNYSISFNCPEGLWGFFANLSMTQFLYVCFDLPFLACTYI